MNLKWHAVFTSLFYIYSQLLFSTLEGSTSCEEHHMHIVPSPMVWHNRLGNDLDCIWRLKLVLLLPVYLIPFFTTQQLCRIIFHFWSVVYISMSDMKSSYHVGFWPPPSLLCNKRSISVIFFSSHGCSDTPLGTWSMTPLSVPVIRPQALHNMSCSLIGHIRCEVCSGFGQ